MEASLIHFALADLPSVEAFASLFLVPVTCLLVTCMSSWWRVSGTEKYCKHKVSAADMNSLPSPRECIFHGLVNLTPLNTVFGVRDADYSRFCGGCTAEVCEP